MEVDWSSILHEQSEAFYVDSGLTYSGVPATTISGLDHLVGESVSILADGSPHPARTVNASGEITLQQAASVVQAGLPMTATIAPMRLEAGSANGTSQGKPKKITTLVIRFHETSSGKAGPSSGRLDEITFRRPSDPMDEPVPPFTGDKRIDWESEDSSDGFIIYVNDKPLPATVLGFFPSVNTEESD